MIDRDSCKTAISPLEPQSFLLACNDSTLRFMNTGHKSNRFFTTLLWKNLERKVFRDMKFHPTEFGLVSIVTERQISLMDVHAHVVLSEFTINELGDGDILFARWLKRSIVEVFVDSRFEKEVIKVVQANRAYKPDNARPSTKVNSKFQVVHKKYNRELDKNCWSSTFRTAASSWLTSTSAPSSPFSTESRSSCRQWRWST